MGISTPYKHIVCRCSGGGDGDWTINLIFPKGPINEYMSLSEQVTV